MSESTAQKPAWLVDDLGAKGADFIDITTFAAPPERSHGVLFLPDRLEKGYHVEEIRDGVYWVKLPGTVQRIPFSSRTKSHRVT